MGLVEQFCDRAMMLSDGDIKLIGAPHEVGRAYLTENFATRHRDIALPAGAQRDAVRLMDAWTSDGEGGRVDAVGYTEPFTLHMEIEALEPIAEPGVAMWIMTDDGVRVFSVGARENDEALADLAPGERLEFTVTATNPLSAGRYYVGCSVVRGSAGLDILLYLDRAFDFVSYGAELVGLVGIHYTGTVTRSRPSTAVLG
jgi:hypothetical protein